MSAQNNSNRIDWIDAAKGIGILLVIIGHSISYFPVRGAIFSFHMPLFFVCSGLTFRFSNTFAMWRSKAVAAFPKTIVTAFVLHFIRAVLIYEKGALQGNINHVSISSMLNTFVYSSGVPVRRVIPAIGAV